MGVFKTTNLPTGAIMTQITFTLISETEFNSSIFQKLFDISDLVNIYREPDREKNKKVIEKVMKLAASDQLVANWDISTTKQFLFTVLGVCREDLRARSSNFENRDNLLELGSWVGHFAIFNKNLDLDTKLNLFGYWASVQIFIDGPIEDPENFVRIYSNALESYGITSIDFSSRLKSELVSFLVHQLPILPDPPFSIDIAKLWCQELLSLQKYRKTMSYAANKLNIEIPQIEATPIETITEKREDKEQAHFSSPENIKPDIWSIPELMNSISLKEELPKLLVKLVINTSLSEKTKSQLSKLTPNSDIKLIGPAISFAIRDLWNKYWQNGDKDVLNLAEQSAIYLLSSNYYGDNESRKGQVLHLWINTQLPKLIYLCDLNDLIEDASRLVSYMKDQPNNVMLLAGIVQTHAGECKYLTNHNEIERKNALMQDRKATLENLHRQYKSLTGKNDRENESSAWEYLFPLTLPPARSQDSILDDLDFREIIKKGSHVETFEYVHVNLEKIRLGLNRRLNVRIAPEFVVRPELEIYITAGQKKRQLHPDFSAAIESLDKEDYDRAARLFDRLASRVNGFAVDIARNYQAYALAKKGEPMAARVELRRLYEQNSRFSSVYWNYACCLPSEVTDQKLESFVEGLDRAPHPKLLFGAVYLASEKYSSSLSDEVNTERLKSWLSLITFAEALLLLYYLEYDNLGFDQRDTMILRLGQYSMDGEPDIPDPMVRNIPGSKMASIIPALTERKQEKVIEFWLRCHETIARDRFDYWELKTDFLDKMNKKREGADSFREELKRRLMFMANVQKNSNFRIEESTRRRLEYWLRQCMTRELKPIGQSIYNEARKFSAGRVNILPKDYKVKNYYIDVDEYPNGKPVSSYTPPAGSSAEFSTVTQPPSISSSVSLDDFDSVLAKVGAVCKNRLHEVKHLLSVREELDNLINALRQKKADNACNSLVLLIAEWEKNNINMSKQEQRLLLDSAKSRFSEFKNNLQKELNEKQQELALPLFEAFLRVNDHIARTANLLPTLSISTIDNLPASIDPLAMKTAIAVRVNCQPTDIPVRLKVATATLDDNETEFSLRDDLDMLSVMVGPNEPALLTFEVLRSQITGNRDREVRVDIKYEYAGSSYAAPSMKLSITHKQCPPLPTKSPYVFGRPLQPNEIEQLFVGRDDEQKAVLKSIENGQQQVRYLEGIRRIGKSSLLGSLEHIIRKQGIALIPVQLSPDNHEDAGMILYNLLYRICVHPEVAEYKITLPSEEKCKSNPSITYEEFNRELGEKIPDKRVVVLLDDFQTLVEMAGAAKETNRSLANGIRGILNKIRELATPNARLLWVFAGQDTKDKFRKLLPNVLFWGDMISLPITFLEKKSIGEILTKPLYGTNIVVPDETVERLHFLTGGHPECAQQLADFMVTQAINEKRIILTPADADAAASDLANNGDNFADTWYPLAQLTTIQRELMAAFIQAVPVSGHIEPHRLIPGNQLTDAHKSAIDDLVARKIIVANQENGNLQIQVKAIVLDMWLHRTLPKSATDMFNGSVALFVDVANLTSGTGGAVLSDLDTSVGEGIAGRFALKTVLNIIDNFSASLSPAPIAVRWAVNYPKGSPAVIECSNNGYYIENIPDELFAKGTDDHVLVDKISDVERGYPTVNHYVLVTGDKDYRIKVQNLLKNGKYVHVISRANALASPDKRISFDYLSREFPERFSVDRLEELLERR